MMRYTLLLAALWLSAAAAYAQLPSQHNQHHNAMLAYQQPATNPLADAAARYGARLEQSEDLQEIYGQYWKSESVNPYVGATIPATATLDVSGYHSPITGHITSNYGYRPRFGRMHRGIDLKLQVGDTVRAAFDGRVRLTRYERRGYGYYVVMRHDNGMETVYGHLSRFLVEPDQEVKAGDPIALGGNTGRSTGPHLHFEMRYMGMAINPADIVDFDKQLPHDATFTFNKAKVEKDNAKRPARKKKATARKKSTKKKASATKKTASSKKTKAKSKK